MTKRARYEVIVEGETARFSCLRHALLFGVMLSERMPGHTIQVYAANGIVGQYKGGNPTPEFKQHHIDGVFR